MPAISGLSLLSAIVGSSEPLPATGASFSLSALVIAVVLLALGGLMVFINTKGKD